jgi:hypothetical protein
MIVFAFCEKVYMIVQDGLAFIACLCRLLCVQGVLMENDDDEAKDCLKCHINGDCGDIAHGDWRLSRCVAQSPTHR